MVGQKSSDEHVFTSKRRSDSPMIVVLDSVEAISGSDTKTVKFLSSEFVTQSQAEIDRATGYFDALTTKNTVDLLGPTSDMFLSEKNLGTEDVAISGAGLNFTYRQDGSASSGHYSAFSHSPFNGSHSAIRDLGSTSTSLQGFDTSNVGRFASSPPHDEISGSSPNASSGNLGSVLGGALIGTSTTRNHSPASAVNVVVSNVDLVDAIFLPRLVPPPLPAAPSANRAQPVPEPASLASFSLILCGAIAEYRRRRRK